MSGSASFSLKSSKALRGALLIASLVYVVGLAVYLSQLRMMWSDEFLAWDFITDPSWRHMIQSWNRGADSGGLLFYVLGRLAIKIFGHHVLVLRLTSALSLWAAAVLWWRLLSRKFSDSSALLAVIFISLCSFLFVYHLAEARFYGLLMLGTALSVTAVVWVEDTHPPRWTAYIVCLATNAFLVSAHMLGVLYSGIIVVALILTGSLRNRKIWAVLGCVSSWLVMLGYLAAIRAGAGGVKWIAMPNLRELSHQYLNDPNPSRVFNIAGGLLIVAALCIAMSRSGKFIPKPRQYSVLPVISVLLVALPLEIYVVSHLYKPLFVDRYMMPYDFGLSFALAWSISVLGKSTVFLTRPNLRRGMFLMSLCILISLHVLCVKVQPKRQYKNIAALADFPSPLPMVVPDYNIFAELRYYGGASARDVFYLSPPIPAGEIGTSQGGAVVKQGYAPAVVEDAAFFNQHQQFLYVDFPRERWVYDRLTQGSNHMRIQDAGTVWVSGEPIHILSMEKQ